VICMPSCACSSGGETQHSWMGGEQLVERVDRGARRLGKRNGDRREGSQQRNGGGSGAVVSHQRSPAVRSLVPACSRAVRPVKRAKSAWLELDHVLC